MKSALKGLFILVLAAGAAEPRAWGGGQQTTPTPTFRVPSQLSFEFELDDSSGLVTADSWWEISIQLHMADQKDFAQYLAQRKGGQINVPEPGIIFKRGSFQRRTLSRKANRRVEVEVPVDKELRERFMGIKATPQVVWLTGTARFHAGKDVEIINDEVNPTWDLRHFIDKEGRVKLTLTPDRQLTWTTGLGKTGVKKALQ
jgi:hypothetical protein